MVHILEVERGLKCGCICPGCDRRLVARTKAVKVVPHFAPYGPACGGAPETALHKLAKQIVADSLTLVVPKRIAIHDAVERALPGATDIKLESARIEYNDADGIVPDLYVTVKGHVKCSLTPASLQSFCRTFRTLSLDQANLVQSALTPASAEDDLDCG
ncbi:hypothetical protein SAMN04488498_1812 [Mesorhizobium albiziae]|uniref:Uncharacterized protein n=1 Tax=Neomesorhizobium albiziae TaxID=335020 RepID=A0A1I4G4R2_9HYPH|nr:hypothetical protein [Mesorhizobium albiziae]GLS33771.1 hypothetical protein GCM10007937_54840 [Mesorhizobium albiziae]SFL24480.1 hypothetical protein SAMN04488498_1812 [Mesorhizobium albiziae]